MSQGNQLFPIFIKLNQINTLVVGGGKVGLEKVTALLSSDPGARVWIVAREVLPELRDFIRAFREVRLAERDFLLNDLNDKHLVICATGDPALNEVIRDSCHQRRLLLNIADTPDLCDFYLSAVFKKGDLKIGISTNGKSPTVAKRLRELFEEVFPEEIEDVLLQVNALRNQLKGDLPDKIRKLNKLTQVLLEHPDHFEEFLERYESRRLNG